MHFEWSKEMGEEKRATLRGEEGCPGNGVQLVQSNRKTRQAKGKGAKPHRQPAYGDGQLPPL